MSEATVYVMLTLETPHFLFQSFGRSEKSARKALDIAWKKHASRTGADPAYLDDEEADIQVTLFRLGEALRDGEQIR